MATSWDTFHPNSLRGQNLHNITIEGMKNQRILRSRNEGIDPARINTSNIIDIALKDNHGLTRRLTSLRGKVVFLDFHVFASENSTKRIMMLRELYDKYHASGLEIYQVSTDEDEHFWKQQTAALPWVCVRAEGVDANEILMRYNVQQLPTFFLVDRNSMLYKRDTQMKDFEAELRGLL